jgi:hypothetical protein
MLPAEWLVGHVHEVRGERGHHKVLEDTQAASAHVRFRPQDILSTECRKRLAEATDNEKIAAYAALTNAFKVNATQKFCFMFTFLIHPAGFPPFLPGTFSTPGGVV